MFSQACGVPTDDGYIVTGGSSPFAPERARREVTLYSRTGDTETLSSLTTARMDHACGKFVDEEGATVSI